MAFALPMPDKTIPNKVQQNRGQQSSHRPPQDITNPPHVLIVRVSRTGLKDLNDDTDQDGEQGEDNGRGKDDLNRVGLGERPCPRVLPQSP